MGLLRFLTTHVVLSTTGRFNIM